LRDALRVRRERDRAVDAWLRDQVVPAAQALRDDPARALSADQVRAELKKIARTPRMNWRVRFAPEALAQLAISNSASLTPALR
jgi:hypothetical protein